MSGGLVLNVRKDEKFILTDQGTGTVTKIKVFNRDNGGLAVRFEAPPQVKIDREQVQE